MQTQITEILFKSSLIRSNISQWRNRGQKEKVWEQSVAVMVIYLEAKVNGFRCDDYSLWGQELDNKSKASQFRQQQS